MKHTKRLKVLIFTLILLSSPFIYYKLQGTKIYWLKFDSEKIGEDYGDIFIIQNPPSSKKELIKLIENMNDTLDLKSRIITERYIQAFYKETFNLTRFYKPYHTAFIGTYIDIRVDNAEFTKEHLVDYLYKDDASQNEYGELSPIYPYYIFYKYDSEGLRDSEYYPKGLKNNHNKHWENIR